AAAEGREPQVGTAREREGAGKGGRAEQPGTTGDTSHGHLFSRRVAAPTSVLSMLGTGHGEGDGELSPSPGCSPARGAAGPQRGQPCAAARAAPGSTAAIRSSTSSVCAVETNQASKAEGGRYTPPSSIAWKKRVNAAVSCTFASS